MKRTKLILLLTLLLAGAAQTVRAQDCIPGIAQLNYIIRDKSGAILDPAEVTLPAGMQNRTSKEIELPAELGKDQVGKKVKVLSISVRVCYPRDYRYQLTVERNGQQMRLIFGQLQNQRGPYLVDSLPFQSGVFFVDLGDTKEFTSADKWQKQEAKPADKGTQN